jgi:hypothetical protein
MYRARWEEVDFDLALASAPKQGYYPHFVISFGKVLERPGISMDLYNQIENFDLKAFLDKPGNYHIKAIYKDGKTLSLLVNGKPLQRPIAVLRPDGMQTLAVNIEANAEIRIANIKVRGEPEK